MPYYMYFPFKESELSEEEKAAKDRWLHNERINHKDVIILYHGDKLSNIPSNAKIYISLHGTSQANYNVTDGKNTISVQEIARRMIADGLLDDPKILRLKLFFCDYVNKALPVAQAFLQSLRTEPKSEQSRIRVDYYPDHLLASPGISSSGKEIHKHGLKSPVRSAADPRARDIRQSLYTNQDCMPKLTRDDIQKVINQYDGYKSSRLHGLSGLFNLNGFFSTSESADIMKKLLSATSETDRFHIAANYVKYFPEAHFAKFLVPAINHAVEDNKKFWEGGLLPFFSDMEP